MINLEIISAFHDFWETLKETSLDDHDRENHVYLTESSLKALNFDKVKEDYTRDLGLSEMPGSCDALLQTSNKYIFIEFKAGQITHRKAWEIGKKIYDTLLIFTDLVPMTIKDLRDNAEFILVYTDAANENNQDSEFISKKKAVQESPSLHEIGKAISAYAKQEIICFGLGKFERYCFHKVHTYNLREFEEYLTGI